MENKIAKLCLKIWKAAYSHPYITAVCLFHNFSQWFEFELPDNFSLVLLIAYLGAVVEIFALCLIWIIPKSRMPTFLEKIYSKTFIGMNKSIRIITVLGIVLLCTELSGIGNDPNFELITLITFGVFMAVFFTMVMTAKSRKKMTTFMLQFGRFAPIVVVYIYVLIAHSFFSQISYYLYQHYSLFNYIVTSDAPINTQINLSSISDFYFWHFLNSIPVLNITENLHWKLPIQEENGWSGSLVIMFYLVFITPLAVYCKDLWQKRQWVESRD